MSKFLIKDGVVDVVYSPDDNGYYLHRYIFSEKRDDVSRVYKTKAAAETAFQEGRARFKP